MTLRQDLHVYQGQDFSYNFLKKGSNGLPVDVSGYTARMAIKGTFNGVLQAYLSSVAAEQINGSIALDNQGNVTLQMTGSQTAQLAGELNALTVVLLRNREPAQTVFEFIDITQPIAQYLYDLRLTSPAGVTTREIQGRVRVFRQITT